jgi:hypothetical protein
MIEVTYMKKLIAIMLALVFVSAPAIALAGGNNPPKKVVPEIDAATGAKGIAVLITGLFLAAEALRRRR